MQEQKKIDVINRLLEDCIMAYPVSSFIIGIYQQYQRRGWLTKRQLQGLYEKALAIEEMAPEKLAALEAIIRKMPNRHKSELPEIKPLYTKDEAVGQMIEAILLKYPQHKRVLFFQSKYNNNEPLSPAEITELNKFRSILKVQIRILYFALHNHLPLKRLHPAIFSLASGILLWLSWPTSPLTAFVFFGFVPMLLVADLDLTRKKFFGHSFLAMLIWNAGATWWIWNSTSIGSVAAIAANALLMCLPWWGYVVCKEKYGKRTGYFSPVAFWMAFEFIHLNWQLSWPWLNLGNVFASNADWVQWYEYTGIGGGTLWVLVVNLVIYDWMFGAANRKKSKVRRAISIAGILLFPFIISVFIETSKQVSITMVPQVKENVIIVQPNIDPYSKFEESNITHQIQTHLQLSEAAIDSNIKLIIWPETALAAGNVPIDEIPTSAVYKPVFDFVNRHPNLTLLTGIETVRWYGTEKPHSKYARKIPSGYYYDSYNAGISIKANQPLQFYVKSKLVPGVETLPTFLNFMGPVFEKFGGTTGGYAMDTASVAFTNQGNPFITAPIICYESIYGEYVASYVAKGANLLTIMTNDGWWGNTPGHKQHLHYARLRAIETRRWIARSANTGISAVIDNYGNIRETRPWDTPATIRYHIPVCTGETFYVKYGDLLYRAFALMAGILLLWNLVTLAQKRFSRTR